MVAPLWEYTENGWVTHFRLGQVYVELYPNKAVF